MALLVIPPLSPSALPFPSRVLVQSLRFKKAPSCSLVRRLLSMTKGGIFKPWYQMCLSSARAVSPSTCALSRRRPPGLLCKSAPKTTVESPILFRFVYFYMN